MLQSLRLSVLLMACCSSGYAETKGDPLHLDWRDTTASPQENFFAYANGTWQKQNPIPSHYASWSSFSQLMEKIENTSHQMLINASADPQQKPGSLIQKVGDFYYSGMDIEEINRLGSKPIEPILARIDAIRHLAQLEKEIAYLHLIGVHALFDFGNMQDFKDSQEMIAASIQDGLTLPDRDYYLKEDEKFTQVRSAFLTYITNVFQLIGEPLKDAKAHALVVMQIETHLASASKPQEELRDPRAIYHMMDIDALNKMTPHFSWTRYLQALGLSHVKRMNVATPDFIRALDKQLGEISLSDWKVYLRWQVLSAFADDLSEPFEREAFKMAQVLRGVKTLPPRWKRVLRTENSILGFAIGKLYVEKYASPDAKAQVLEIMQNIDDVLEQELGHLSWMTPKTRQAAIKKLALIEKRVGYPTTWWDYSTLVIHRNSYVLNIIHGNEFLARRNFNKIGKPIDRTEWAMTPQTVNAYYDPSMNNINIPMGILSAPFFDAKAPAAVNYGAIGSVIGHEITHAFDDQGAKFDGYGNLKNWWTAEDLKKFQSATDCIAKQFSNYTMAGLSLKGSLVVGEATADLGGLTLAYLAFHASKEYKNAPVVNGLTPDQQFFLGFAHVWANNIRPEQAHLYVMTDPHPPAQYRVNGTLRNMPAFKKAFTVPDSLMSKKQCVIW